MLHVGISIEREAEGWGAGKRGGGTNCSTSTLRLNNHQVVTKCRDPTAKSEKQFNAHIDTNRKNYWPVSGHCYPYVLTLTISMNDYQLLPQRCLKLLKSSYDY